MRDNKKLQETTHGETEAVTKEFTKRQGSLKEKLDKLKEEILQGKVWVRDLTVDMTYNEGLDIEERSKKECCLDEDE